MVILGEGIQTDEGGYHSMREGENESINKKALMSWIEDWAEYYRHEAARSSGKHKERCEDRARTLVWIAEKIDEGATMIEY